jgi:4-amino-4-deoxy-L-arabinose transferase-like glycosyltransferase
MPDPAAPDSADRTDPSAPVARPDRDPLWVAVVAFPLLALRAWDVAGWHSSLVDHWFHLTRGFALYEDALEGFWFENPPAGSALVVLPQYLIGKLFGPLTLQGELDVAAIWGAAIATALLVVVFCWVRSLHGRAAGFLATLALLAEPTLAAVTHAVAVDLLATTAIVLSLWCSWRYTLAPSWRRLVVASLACGLALVTKHTALPVLAAIPLFLLVNRPVRATDTPPPARPRLLPHALAFLPLVACFVFAWSMFDVSPPLKPQNDLPPETPAFVESILRTPLPAGSYQHSFLAAVQLSREGRPAFLWGERNLGGWWYYFPVVSLYKVPLGLLALFAVAVLSLALRPLKRGEWSLLIPMALWCGLLFASSYNIGIRHFLPVVVLAMMFATRVVLLGRAGGVVALLAVLASLAHVTLAHPNYQSYLNWPRERAWLILNDSNLDWGQSAKQVNAWVRDHVPPGRPVGLGHFSLFEKDWRQWIDERRITLLDPKQPPPTTGLLIVSPTWVVGLYDWIGPNYTFLRGRDPVAIIGDTMLVYDLDAPR